MSTFTLFENEPPRTREEIYNMINDGELIINLIGEEWLTEDDNPWDTAHRIATACKEVYGLIIFASSLYYRQREVMTIMDILEDSDMCYKYNISPVHSWLLARAFKKAGFKYAGECHMKEMRQIYAQMGYPPYGLMAIRQRDSYHTYDYESIKEDNMAINTEL